MLKSENQNKEELSVDDNVFLDNLNQSDIPQTKVDQLSRSQKIAVAVLAFFALLIFVFWMSQFSKNINSPFRYSENTKSSRITSYNVCYTKLLRLIGQRL